MADYSEPLRLPQGVELSGGDLEAVTVSRPCRIIIVAGEPAAGKTTLLTAIYELFRTGPVGEFIFAGSLTLPAFEERCHSSRAASGRTMPETVRTIARQEPAFLHFALCRQVTGERHDLLLSDISGEDFAAARDSTDDALRLSIVRIASRFCLLLDAETLQNRRSRHAVVANSRLLLRSLVEAEVLTKASNVELLLTKVDMLNTDRLGDVEFVEQALNDIRREFEGAVAHIDIGRVAARPSGGQFSEGLPSLIDRWCPELRPSAIHFLPSAAEISTPYDRFLLTVPDTLR
jgi:Double-GTPase 2